MWTEPPPFIETDPATSPGTMFDIVSGTMITRDGRDGNIRSKIDSNERTSLQIGEYEMEDGENMEQSDKQRLKTWEEIRRRN